MILWVSNFFTAPDCQFAISSFTAPHIVAPRPIAAVGRRCISFHCLALSGAEDHKLAHRLSGLAMFAEWLC